jgi:hypothetical protein
MAWIYGENSELGSPFSAAVRVLYFPIHSDSLLKPEAFGPENAFAGEDQ